MKKHIGMGTFRCLEAGFSMIELMVVILVIGILGSIAIPAYQEYIVRAKVIELFAFAQPAKIAITDALIANTNKALINNESLGLEIIENQGKIQRMTIDAGVIKIQANPQALNLAAAPVLQILLEPRLEAGMVQWHCRAEPVTFKKYVPSNCRE